MCFGNILKNEKQLHESIWRAMERKGVIVVAGEIKCTVNHFHYKATLTYKKEGAFFIKEICGYGDSKKSALIALKKHIDTQTEF